MHAFLRLAVALCSKGNLTDTLRLVRDLYLVGPSLPYLREACGADPHDGLAASPKQCRSQLEVQCATRPGSGHQQSLAQLPSFYLANV